MTVRLSGVLSDFVAANVNEGGFYENVSEYIRDLIRRDKIRVEQDAFDKLKAELTTHSFAAPESSYRPLQGFRKDRKSWRRFETHSGGIRCRGYFFCYEQHFVYWRCLSNGDIGSVTILHQRMHQIERFRDDFDL